MNLETKALIAGCAAMSLLSLSMRNPEAASGWFVAFLGWFVVGLKELREVK